MPTADGLPGRAGTGHPTSMLLPILAGTSARRTPAAASPGRGLGGYTARNYLPTGRCLPQGQARREGGEARFVATGGGRRPIAFCDAGRFCTNSLSQAGGKRQNRACRCHYSPEKNSRIAVCEKFRCRIQRVTNAALLKDVAAIHFWFKTGGDGRRALYGLYGRGRGGGGSSYGGSGGLF